MTFWKQRIRAEDENKASVILAIKYKVKADNFIIPIFYSPVLFLRYRNSHQRYSMKKAVLKNFTKFTETHLCMSLFVNKVAGLRHSILIKKRLWHRCFLVNFVKLLRTHYLQNTSGWLLLTVTTVFVIMFRNFTMFYYRPD